MIKKILPSDILQFEELYNKGVSLRQIAKKTGWGYSTVLRRLRKEFKKIGRKLFNAGRYKRKYRLDNEDYFERINSGEKAYFLGLLMADGNVYKNRVVLSLECKDRYLIECFADRLGTDKPIGVGTYRTKTPRGNIHYTTRCVLEIVSDEMVKDLAKYSVVPNKTFTIEFPEIPSEFYSHFIRGYFDGDGCVVSCLTKDRPNSLSHSFSIVGREEFLKRIQQVLTKECNLNNTFIRKEKNIYVLMYNGNLQIYRIAQYLYKDSSVHMERKYKKMSIPTGIIRDFRGENCPTSKLTNQLVLLIRELCKDHTSRKVSKMTGVGISSVDAIKHRRQWKHI